MWKDKYIEEERLEKVDKESLVCCSKYLKIVMVNKEISLVWEIRVKFKEIRTLQM